MFDRAEPIFELPPYEADNPGGCFVEAMYYDIDQPGLEIAAYTEDYYPHWWLLQAESGDIVDSIIDCPLPEINHPFLWYDEEPNYDMAQSTSEIAPHSENSYPPEWLLQAESGDIADSIIDYALSEINLPLVRSDQEQNYEIAQSDLEIAPHAEDYYPSEWVIQAEACGAEEPSVECPIIDMNVASAFNDLPEIFKHVLIKFDMKSFQNNSFSSMRKAEPLLESAFLKD